MHEAAIREFIRARGKFRFAANLESIFKLWSWSARYARIRPHEFPEWRPAHLEIVGKKQLQTQYQFTAVTEKYEKVLENE